MAKVKEANMKKMKKTTKSRSFLEKLKVKYFILFSLQATVLEGTVSVILSDPPCKDGNAWFTTVPCKALSE